MTDRDPQNDDRRREIEFLLEQCIEQIHRGQEVGPMEVLESHPDLAADLLRELDTFEALATVGAGARTEGKLGVLGDYTLLARPQPAAPRDGARREMRTSPRQRGR